MAVLGQPQEQTAGRFIPGFWGTRNWSWVFPVVITRGPAKSRPELVLPRWLINSASAVRGDFHPRATAALRSLPRSARPPLEIEGVLPRCRRQWRRREAPHLRHDLVQSGFGFESAPADECSPLYGSGGVCAESFGQSNWGRIDCPRRHSERQFVAPSAPASLWKPTMIFLPARSNSTCAVPSFRHTVALATN
jgi:hypothetical protein